jgi:catalase
VDHVRADHDRGAGQKRHYENPFDITKIWRHAEYPLIEVGELELNRWPENYFAEVEQAAFTPAHVVPGIGFSPDKFLQGSLFVYGDAQRYRLGVNHNLIPVNQAKGVKGGVADYHRDGFMRTDGKLRRHARLYPQLRRYWTAQPEVAEPPLDIEGAMWRYDPKDDPTDDCFRAGGDLWRVMTEDKKAAAHLQHRRRHRPLHRERQIPPRRPLPEGRPGIRPPHHRGHGARSMDKVLELAKLSNDDLNKRHAFC